MVDSAHPSRPPHPPVETTILPSSHYSTRPDTWKLLTSGLALITTKYQVARHLSTHHFLHLIIWTVTFCVLLACFNISMYRSFDQVRRLKGLSLMTINARSLERKIGQLGRLAFGLDYLCVTETWFNETIPSATVNMPRMALFRTDRPNSVTRRGGGGCGLLCAV